jgi:hypothetical protein
MNRHFPNWQPKGGLSLISLAAIRGGGVDPHVPRRASGMQLERARSGDLSGAIAQPAKYHRRSHTLSDLFGVGVAIGIGIEFAIELSRPDSDPDENSAAEAFSSRERKMEP